MGNSTALGLASFATGFLGGMNERRDSEQKNAALAEELAWKREQRQAEREKLRSDRELRVSLADAVRPAKVDTGYQVTDQAGSDAFTKDADAAAMMSDMSASREQAPSLASATRVQETAYRDPRQASAAQAEYNSQPAMLDRMATATMPHDPTKGMGLQSAAAKAREGIEAADKKKQTELDERFNTEVANIVSSRPEWWVAAAEMATNSKFGPIKDFTVTPEMSEDGKTVKFVATNPSGKKQTMGEFSADEAGAQKWMQASAKVDAKTKLGWLADRAKYLQQEEKANKPPSGYQWTDDGKLRAIPGGPGDREGGGGGDRAPSGYRFTQDGSLEPIPGGPASKAGGLNSMDRMLIDGRRKDAKREVDAITEQLSDPMLTIQAKRDPEAQAKVKRLNDRLAEATSEYKRWDGAMSELATSALDRSKPSSDGLSSGTRSARPATWNDKGRESDRMRILQSELARAQEAGDQATVEALQREIQRDGGAPAGLSSGVSRKSGPVSVSSKQDYDALPSGTRYVAPDGTIRTKK